MSRAIEVCCRECRTTFAGVCRERHECLCHYEARRDYRTGRYSTPDPTGNKAAANVDKERKRGNG